MLQEIPLPGQAEPHPQPPLIYIRKEPAWEYKLVRRQLASEEPLGEAELNALGAQGWELVAVFPVAEQVLYYLKRAAS